MRLLYQVNDKWQNQFYGCLPHFTKPLDQIIDDLLRKEKLGILTRPYYLTLDKGDIVFIDKSKTFQALFSSNKNRPYFFLLAGSGPARITNPDKAPEPEEIRYISEKCGYCGWGLKFIEKKI